MSAERYSTARVPYARALGAPSVMAGEYIGNELELRSARPGAYDALAIPSLVNGRRGTRTTSTAAALLPTEPQALDSAA